MSDDVAKQVVSGHMLVVAETDFAVILYIVLHLNPSDHKSMKRRKRMLKLHYIS